MTRSEANLRCYWTVTRRAYLQRAAPGSPALEALASAAVSAHDGEATGTAFVETGARPQPISQHLAEFLQGYVDAVEPG